MAIGLVLTSFLKSLPTSDAPSPLSLMFTLRCILAVFFIVLFVLTLVFLAALILFYAFPGVVTRGLNKGKWLCAPLSPYFMPYSYQNSELYVCFSCSFSLISMKGGGELLCKER